jgi:hypothetical protein
VRSLLVSAPADPCGQGDSHDEQGEHELRDCARNASVRDDSHFADSNQSPVHV